MNFEIDYDIGLSVIMSASVKKKQQNSKTAAVTCRMNFEIDHDLILSRMHAS